MDGQEAFETTDYILIVNSFSHIEKFMEEAQMSIDNVMPMLNEGSPDPILVFQRAHGDSETPLEKLNESDDISRFLVSTDSKEAMLYADEKGWKDNVWGAVLLDNVSHFKIIEYRKVYPVFTG